MESAYGAGMPSMSFSDPPALNRSCCHPGTRPQLMNERFLLRCCAHIGFLTAPAIEILEVSRELKIQMFLVKKPLPDWERL
jgi:hypothetical protein